MRKRSLIIAVALFAAACSAQRAAAPAASAAPLSPAVAQQQLVLISIDGFRWDYINRPGATNLRALAAHGVRAERMIPAFPSLTFPNHYTIVTGLYPDHHGIISNAMVDPALGKFAIGDNPAVRDARWWGGEPIWVTAEKQHERAAPVSWPGSEAPIGGIRPSWWKKFDAAELRAPKVHEVLDLLALPADSAPRLITQYFPEVDHAGHSFGPDAPQTYEAIAQVDSAIGAIIDGIAKLGLTNRVNVIVVSDHGMTQLSSARVVYLDDYVSLDSLDMVDMGAVAELAPKPGHEHYVYEKLHGANPHLTVYRKADIPARFHYNSNSRIPEIVAIADDGWFITSHSRVRPNAAPLGGTHGFDNQLPAMGALFIASGPAFKSGVVVPPFQNIHVYDLMAHLLGLRPAPNDGSLDSTRVMLRNPARTRGASSP
jgi:predicted AlkP superfamily pyrophosphatase or phosphodiesterase